MESSNLQQHLYQRHLADHATGRCGLSYEDAYHYLKECNLYDNIRKTYIPEDISINIPLNGDDTKDIDWNKILFKNVAKFIETSKKYLKIKSNHCKQSAIKKSFYFIPLT